MFIDETWATTAMARRYGRACRGRRVVAAVPHGHWKTTTVIAALRHDGLSAPFPNRHELYCGPLGYQGSKAAMRILQQADVVLALGTRLGPFGTLPQYGIEYWPKGARIVQVDPDHRMIGLTEKIDVGVVGDARAAAA